MMLMERIIRKKEIEIKEGIQYNEKSTQGLLLTWAHKILMGLVPTVESADTTSTLYGKKG